MIIFSFAILGCASIPLLIALVLGPPFIVTRSSRHPRLQRLAIRRKRFALAYSTLLGILSFLWVHASVAWVAAESSMLIYRVSIESSPPWTEKPTIGNDRHQKAVAQELWTRWMIPSSDHDKCNLNNSPACSTLSRMFEDQYFDGLVDTYIDVPMTDPRPYPGIILGALTALIVTLSAKSRLTRRNSS